MNTPWVVCRTKKWAVILYVPLLLLGPVVKLKNMLRDFAHKQCSHYLGEMFGSCHGSFPPHSYSLCCFFIPSLWQSPVTVPKHITSLGQFIVCEAPSLCALVLLTHCIPSETCWLSSLGYPVLLLPAVCQFQGPLSQKSLPDVQPSTQQSRYSFPVYSWPAHPQPHSIVSNHAASWLPPSWTISKVRCVLVSPTGGNWQSVCSCGLVCSLWE